jgi:hypothetical protein
VSRGRAPPGLYVAILSDWFILVAIGVRFTSATFASLVALALVPVFAGTPLSYDRYRTPSTSFLKT